MVGLPGASDAVLFDPDGVLTDTASAHHGEAVYEAARDGREQHELGHEPR
jgi:beta-phosphoglucomutase-like phosphatase (HAD superfamily)